MLVKLNKIWGKEKLIIIYVLWLEIWDPVLYICALIQDEVAFVLFLNESLATAIDNLFNNFHEQYNYIVILSMQDINRFHLVFWVCFVGFVQFNVIDLSLLRFRIHHHHKISKVESRYNLLNVNVTWSLT